MAQNTRIPQTRRLFVHQAALGLVALAGGVGCKGGAGMRFSCTDLSALTPTEKKVRETMGYTDTSLNPKKECIDCVQWVPGAENACGKCKVLAGPVHPQGTCTLFAPKS